MNLVTNYPPHISSQSMIHLWMLIMALRVNLTVFMWATMHYYNTACIWEGVYYFSFSLWRFVKSERETSVSSPCLSSPFLASGRVKVFARLLSLRGSGYWWLSFWGLYRHLIQPHAGAPHRQTLFSHVSKIDAHMLGKALQDFHAIFQCKCSKQGKRWMAG